MKTKQLFSIFLLTILPLSAQKKQENIDENSMEKFQIQQNTIYSGMSQLKNGSVQIKLSRETNYNLMANLYSINTTPYGIWSALYVKEINEQGFIVESKSGDLNAKFFWQISPITSPVEKK